MTETKEHIGLKDEWKHRLEQQGYLVELEKRLCKPNSDEFMVVDVYAEREDEIFIVEVIITNWSGKDPKDYLDTQKKIKFEKVFVDPRGKTRKGYKQLNFWIKDSILNEWNDFTQKHGYEVRTKFLLKCVDIIMDIPELLELDFHKKKSIYDILNENMVEESQNKGVVVFGNKPQETQPATSILQRIERIEREIGL